MNKDTSHFPIIVEYSDTHEKKKILSPKEIDSGRGFKVLATKVD